MGEVGDYEVVCVGTMRVKQSERMWLGGREVLTRIPLGFEWPAS